MTRPDPRLVTVPVERVAGPVAALTYFLVVHAAVAVAVGVTLSTDRLTGPTWAAMSWVPGWPWVWGLPLAGCGVGILFGLGTRHRGVAAVAVQGQAIWYAAQTVGLAVAAVAEDGAVRYPLWVYAGLALVMVGHRRWLDDHRRWAP